MQKISSTDFLSLSIPERIQLVGDIWDSIAVNAHAVSLSEDEKRIIDKRLEQYHKNPDSGSPWEDVKKKILSKQ